MRSDERSLSRCVEQKGVQTSTLFNGTQGAGSNIQPHMFAQLHTEQNGVFERWEENGGRVLFSGV